MHSVTIAEGYLTIVKPSDRGVDVPAELVAVMISV
jgi:hypothetical protein